MYILRDRACAYTQKREKKRWVRYERWTHTHKKKKKKKQTTQWNRTYRVRERESKTRGNWTNCIWSLSLSRCSRRERAPRPEQNSSNKDKHSVSLKFIKKHARCTNRERERDQIHTLFSSGNRSSCQVKKNKLRAQVIFNMYMYNYIHVCRREKSNVRRLRNELD
jgi:hypothetical protein